MGNKLPIIEKVRRFFTANKGKYLADQVVPYFPEEKPDSVRIEINNLVNKRFLKSDPVEGTKKRLYYKSNDLEKAYKAFFTMKPTEPKNPRLWR